jgi:hypothetical protein
MAINNPQNYTFFTGEGLEFYQWHPNDPNGLFVSNWKSKDSSSSTIPESKSEIVMDDFLLSQVV